MPLAARPGDQDTTHMIVTNLQKTVLSLFLCTAFLICAGAAQAAAPDRKSAGKVPTNISAAHMEYNANVQTVIFTGNVHVKRPDFELWAAKMTIYLDKSGKAAPQESGTGGMQAGDIDRIVAEKNVRMKSDTKEGTCDKATYYAKDDRFVMEGNPVLSDKDKSQIRGKKVIHYMSTNRSEIDGGVDAVFFAPDKTERKGGKQ